MSKKDGYKRLLKGAAAFCTVVTLAACSSGLNPGLPTEELTTQAGSCLNRGGTKVKLKSGKGVRIFRKSNVVIDGRGATIRDTNYPLVASYNRGSLCLSGGTFVTNRSVSSSWSASHNSGGIYFRDTPNITVENVAIGVGGKIVGDGIAFKQGARNFRFQDSYVGRAGDDGVENDRNSDGTVDDVLIDSAFTGLSCRHERYSTNRRYDFNVRNSLISLSGRSNDLFKITVKGRNYCKLNLSNNVFHLPNRDAGKIERSILNGGSCRNNTIVYTGGNRSYLSYLRRNSGSCFKVTTDRDVWTKARSSWFSRHSEFSRYR